MKNQIIRKIDNQYQLLDYLIDVLSFNKTKAKAMLVHRCILINNKIVTKYNYVLHQNDEIIINLMPNSSNINTSIDIIYEDNDFIAINKPAGLLSISTNKEKDKTAYHLVREYLNNKYEKIFILHRLDKDTSGVLVFVKNQDLKIKLQENWQNYVLKRCYYGIVDGKFNNDNGHLEYYLKENKNSIVFVSKKNDKLAKLAITDYQVIKSNDKYSLLDISIKTGRKNQIRVSFAQINHPIVSDIKYGRKDKNLNRLALHAYKIEFINPINNRKYCFEAKIPKEFNKLMNNEVK